MNFPEPLESRIAPATFSGSSVTYTDPDGDLVTVTISKGSIEDVFSFDDKGAGEELLQIRLYADAYGREFAGANITVKVIARGGDGLANIGAIDAGGVDLGHVSIEGNLGRIIVGDTKLKTPALKSLTVASLGAAGDEETHASEVESLIRGKLGALTVTAGGLDGAIVHAFGGRQASIGKIHVTGDLSGNHSFYSGSIIADGAIGSVVVNGDFRGGGGDYSGRIFAQAGIKSVTVTGNLVGSSGAFSGSIDTHGNIGEVVVNGSIEGAAIVAGAIRQVNVSGSLIGGELSYSGQISTRGNLGRVQIGGSVIGGAGIYSGFIECYGVLGEVTIGSAASPGNLQGGSGEGSGAIYGGKMISKVAIHGSIISGDGAYSASIRSGIDPDSGAGARTGVIGKLEVTQSIVGHEAQRVHIAALNKIGHVRVGGDIAFADILAGYLGRAARNADAAIGVVSVAGNLTAANIVAGVRDVNGDGFGTQDDVPISSATRQVSRISLVEVGGSVAGGEPEGVSYGITAEHIEQVTIGGAPVPLKTGPRNDFISLPGPDAVNYRLYEAGAPAAN